MDERQLARYFSMARIVAGTIAVLAPSRFARPIGGPAAAHPAASFMTRSWGIRDAAIGALTLRALDDGDAAALVRVGVVIDAVDGLAAVVGYRHLRPRVRAMIVLSGVAAAAAGVKVAAALER